MLNRRRTILHCWKHSVAVPERFSLSSGDAVDLFTLIRVVYGDDDSAWLISPHIVANWWFEIPTCLFAVVSTESIGTASKPFWCGNVVELSQPNPSCHNFASVFSTLTTLTTYNLVAQPSMKNFADNFTIQLNFVHGSSLHNAQISNFDLVDGFVKHFAVKRIVRRIFVRGIVQKFHRSQIYCRVPINWGKLAPSWACDRGRRCVIKQDFMWTCSLIEQFW